jgi:predicted RNA binding protein YcfA (HicA-like mRNA interferase family)
LSEPDFSLTHSTSSHRILKHPDRPHARVTVACHNRDLKRKTPASFIEQSGLTIEDFLELL